MSLAEGLQLLAEADEIIGHNFLAYDEPVLRHLIDDWKFDETKITDTLVLSRLAFPQLFDTDCAYNREFLRRNPGADAPVPNMSGGKPIKGSHSIKAWGFRLRIHKGSFAEDTDWAEWSVGMQDYCELDVDILAKVYARVAKELKKICVDVDLENRPEHVILEHDVQWIIGRQMNYGFKFDIPKARALEATLQKERAKEASLMTTLFDPWWAKKKDRKEKKERRLWVAHPNGSILRTFKATKTREARIDEPGFYHEFTGGPWTEITLKVFNPGSRVMIEDRLKKLYGWEPLEFTDSGRAKIDDDILNGLDYEPAQALAKLFMLDKRLGQLSSGKQAWLSAVEDDGRIHGYVNPLGTITGRMTHSSPNVAQVPSIVNAKGEVPYGRECRELFTVPDGKVLVGGDASSLELVCLAHYMHRYDGGEYSTTVSTGSSAEGTDPHTVNQKAAGLPTRAQAKTFIYAFLYGAGDRKIGTIVDAYGTESRQKSAGKRLKVQFLSQTPALDTLIKKVKKKARGEGFITGPDGRRVITRHVHAALNTVLQHMGAIIMKKAAVILDNDLQIAGLVPGEDYEFVANIHDEFQIEANEDLGDLVGQAIVTSIEKAGAHFGLNCPVTGDYSVGRNWAETH